MRFCICNSLQDLFAKIHSMVQVIPQVDGIVGSEMAGDVPELNIRFLIHVEWAALRMIDLSHGCPSSLARALAAQRAHRALVEKGIVSSA